MVAINIIGNYTKLNNYYSYFGMWTPNQSKLMLDARMRIT